MSKYNKILVFTATFNESENIEKLVADIFDIVPQVDMMVIDDHSPDGTGDILDNLAATYSGLSVVHRKGKYGLGTAHLLAMEYSVKNRYDALITMDADFSHHPKYLPRMLALLENHDFVIGSRYVEGGKSGYGIIRTFISKTANILARNLLSLKLKECTTSYRGFSNNLLTKILERNLNSTGYAFFFEVVYVVCRLTENIAEFPIYFEDRTKGESKISKQEIIKGIITLYKLAVSKRKY